MMMLDRLAVVGSAAVVVVCCGWSSGQVVEQRDPFTDTPDQIVKDKLERMSEIIQKRSDGRVVRVEYVFRGFSMTTGTHGTGVSTWYREGVMTVGGPEETLPELEEIREEGDADEVGEYRMIDYARDLLAGKYSEQLAEVADAVRERGGGELPRLSRAELVEEAVGAYGMHLSEHPEDWFAMREMAMALLELGRIGDAIDLMLVAYEQDPELGILPIPGELFGKYSESTFSKLVVRAVQHVNRKPSGEGWLLVGALMQAQGRFERAGEMIDRAEGLGLDPAVLEGFRESLP